MRRKTGGAILVVALAASLWAGCRSVTLQPLELPRVDLERFMGDWYVIANIPTPFVKNAYNAVQNYQLNADGTIATTFTFNEGGFDGKSRTLRPKAYVREGTIQRGVGHAVRADPRRVPDCVLEPGVHGDGRSPAATATSSGSWPALR